jgi:uncharacterized FAD-dependent dehydrogenase
VGDRRVKYNQPLNDGAPCSHIALFGLKNREQRLEKLHNVEIHNFAKCKVMKGYGGSGDIVPSFPNFRHYVKLGGQLHESAASFTAKTTSEPVG